jgi:hypothetical protein
VSGEPDSGDKRALLKIIERILDFKSMMRRGAGDEVKNIFLPLTQM